MSDAVRVISRYTWAVFGIAIGIILVAFVLVSLQVGGEAGVAAASDIGEVLVVGLAATAILRSANILGSTTALGRAWLLIGIGASMYAVGDAVWTVVEVGLKQEVPYPGLPDLFYLAEYPLFAVGIMTAGLAFKGLVDLKRPALIASLVGVGLSVIVTAFILIPAVFVEGVGPAERLFSTLYPLGDVVLMIAPAAFVLAVVAQLGGGRLAWPWWAVGAGASVIAVSDAAYSWLSASNLYASGNPIDYGWSLGHALVMLGALIARDLARPRAVS